MLVVQKDTEEIAHGLNRHPFSELLNKRHPIAPLNVRAIFYAHASPETEFLGEDDYTDETGVTLVSVS